MASKRTLTKREKRLRTVREAVDILLAAYGGQDRRQLCSLWDNCEMVLGDDLAPLALPLGHKDSVLLVGAEDSMALQELSLQSPEILERANAFMDAPFFSQVRVILLQGQRPLNERRPPRPLSPARPPMPPRPPRLGGLMGAFSPDSLAGPCYEAYVAAFRPPHPSQYAKEHS